MMRAFGYAWLLLTSTVLCADKRWCVHDQQPFLQLCSDALEDQEIFNNIRSHPLYQIFMENFDEESARSCRDFLEKNRPDLLSQVSAQMSYSALRSAKILADLEQHFGSLAGFKILQIGADSGDLCQLITSQHRVGSYAIVDLPPCLSLTKKMLDIHDIQNIQYLLPEEIKDQQYDLIISHYVFSELHSYFQKQYMDRCIRYAKRGYFVCRFPFRHEGVKAWTKEEMHHQFIKRNISIQTFPEEPLTNQGNCLILFAL